MTLFDVIDPRPVHLIARSGDPKTICGLKEASRPKIPYILARFAADHDYPMTRCPTCWENR